MNKDKRRGIVEDLDGLDMETDPERGHALADQILLDAVPKKVREAYERAVARAPWWASA